MLNQYNNFFLPIDNIQKALDYYNRILGLKLKLDFASKGPIAFNTSKEDTSMRLKDTALHSSAVPCIWCEVKDVNLEYQSLFQKA